MAGALLQKSAKPTNESSPALQRWEPGHDRTESAKRTNEKGASFLGVFSRPLRGLRIYLRATQR